MKIFLTGSSGFIAQHLYRLLGKHHSVSTYDPQVHGLLRPGQLPISGHDWVIHLGANSCTTETNVSKILDNNLSWSIELFEICNSQGINFQFASSASVYGNRSPEQGQFIETDPCQPLNYYAMSKYFFEQYLNTRKPNVIWQCFRYFNVYGSGEEHKQSQASPHTQFALQAARDGVIQVFEGSEHMLRDFVPVEQVAMVHLKMLNGSHSGIWNIGSGLAQSFLSVAQSIAKQHNATVKTVPFPEHLRNKYQYYTCANTTKLENALCELQ